MLVHETVRTVKVAIKKLEVNCIIVHLLQEVLDIIRMIVELVGADALLVFLVVATLLVDEATEVLGKHEGRIIPRWQHSGVQELFGSQNVALLKLSCGTAYVGTHIADGDLHLV